ncbi:hypothetical protein HPB48_003793 [Haemaphysalis longicornis]|uniref:DUF7041 domain-containing protein n=1 Tax=Haemaphysalis longicornis TaxID=44386 RepID=A0A9J6F7D2_HAELO|nr:hypothetical protein HPB48_003793 [Haemaphysalis longicornis]
MTDPRNLAPSGPLLPDASSLPPDVTVVQLRLPTFVRKNPHVWFAQVEAVFDLHRVTSETTRYRHLLCNLPPEVADEVADVIGAPLNDAPYQRLKQSILDRTTVSESARLRHLLTHEELGDRRPSQLLNTMRQLVGASNVDTNGALLKELFLQRLPQSTRIVLAAAGNLTLDRAAELADKVHDATSPSAAILDSTAESSAVSRLETRIDQLAASIEALRTLLEFCIKKGAYCGVEYGDGDEHLRDIEERFAAVGIGEDLSADDDLVFRGQIPITQKTLQEEPQWREEL